MADNLPTEVAEVPDDVVTVPGLNNRLMLVEAILAQLTGPVVAPRANPPITIGPFANVPAPGSPIRSDWPQQITNYVVNNDPVYRSKAPRLLPPVRTQAQTTPFTIPADNLNAARTWLVLWFVWSMGMSANGTYRLAFKISGGAEQAVFTVPYAAGSAPVPNVTAIVPWQTSLAAGASALNMEANQTGGTGGTWTADGYLTIIGFA